jgi:chitin synthase
MFSTLIGPATIIMMIAGALVSVFDLTLTNSYIASLVPAILFSVVCVTCRSNIQLIIAKILSGVYVIIMMVVLAGVIIIAVTDSVYHPSVVFIMGLISIFLMAALLHPRECRNIVHGMLYYVLTPAGFLVLNIYSLCNLNDVSWGTRENATTTEKAKQEKGGLANISPFTKLKESLFKPSISEKDTLLKLLAMITDIMGMKGNSTTGGTSEEAATAPTPARSRAEQQNSSKPKNISEEKVDHKQVIEYKIAKLRMCEK